MKKSACLVALLSALSLDAVAWGNDGHRAVGAIADQLLAGTHAQEQVAALLLPGESLEKVSVWADCVKGRYCGPQTPEMLEYTNANPAHWAYHYTDIPFQNGHYRDGDVGSSEYDLVQTLRQAIVALQGKGDAASNPHHFTGRQALLLVIHLVGDIHQPLHVGVAYVGKDGQFAVPETRAQIDGVKLFGTRGGNSLLLDDQRAAPPGTAPIRPAPPKGRDRDPENPGVDTPGVDTPGVETPGAASARSFHSYWDSTVVDYAMRRIGAKSPRQFAQRVIGARPVVEANKGDASGWPYQWADDALVASKLAHAGAAAGPIARQTGRNGEFFYAWPLAVPHDYPESSSALARTQLVKGGYHLAALLRAIWP
jgi:hypothetical protein